MDGKHDFDQRLDGPMQQPRVSIDIPPHEVSSSAIASPDSLQSPQSLKYASTTDDPTSGEKVDRRRSMQLPGEDSRITPYDHPGRRSTQITRPGGHRRTSRDFDIRRDGPYGRPSLTMTRRRSSILRDIQDAESLEHGEETGQSAPPNIGVGGDGSVDTQAATLVNSPSPPNARPAFEPEPPPLNYSLMDRKRSIIIFWSLIIIDCIAAPIALYFALHYHTHLKPNTLFSIVTAALGGVSIIEYVLRMWRLWRRGSTCRVIGARRSYFDWFHWNFSVGWVVVIVELIVGTLPENPPIRLLAMPCASMMYAFGTELIIVDILRYFRVPAPVRISSIPRGSQLRPCIYSVIEDVCAVDGSGGTEFREALNRRYEASHVFRAMLRRLGLFWAIGAEAMAVVLTILIFTIHPEAAYVVGWSAPFVWGGIWTAITIVYVKRKLREERVAWARELAEKEAQA